MTRWQKSSAAGILAAIVALPAIFGSLAVADVTQRLAVLPDGEEKRLLTAACGGCHGLEVVLDSRKDEKQWQATVSDMISRGAQIFPEEVDILVVYLARYFGP